MVTQSLLAEVSVHRLDDGRAPIGGVISRRTVLGSLAILTGAIALAACGSTPAGAPATPASTASLGAASASARMNAGSSAAPTAAPTAASQTAASTKAVTLTWLASRSALEVPVWQGMADAYNRTHASVTVNYLNDPAGWQQKLTALMAAGTGPDIVRLESNGFTDLVRKSYFLSLDPYVQKASSLDLPDFFSQALEAFKVQGKQYAMPMVLSSLVMNYNRRLLSEAGVSVPAAGWTWNDYLQLSQSLTKAGSAGTDQWGTTWETNTLIRAVAFVWQNGGELFDQQYSKAALDQAPAVEAFTFLTDMFYKWHVAPTPADLASAKRSMDQLFTDQKIATRITGPWNRGIYNQAKDLDWDVIPLPKGKDSDVTPLFVGGYPITTQSKQPDDAWDLVQFLTSKDSAPAWAKVGTSSPARKSAASSSAFLSEAGPPKNAKVYVDYAAQSGRPSPDFAGYVDVGKTIEDQLAPMWQGKIAPQEALTKAAPVVNALLQKEGGQQ